MKKNINYITTSAFERDIDKLQKKYKTLKEDLEIAKRNALELRHVQGVDNNSVVLIPGYENSDYQIYKLRKFACRALKGKGVRSGIRVIYAYGHKSSAVTFIQIYHKATCENEDKERIKSFLKS